MKSAYLLSEGRTATTDYFLYPHLESLGFSVNLLDTRKQPTRDALQTEGALVVISRYLPGAWRNVLNRFINGGSKIVYFMDDDLFDIKALNSLPWRYRLKILRMAMLRKNLLTQMCDEFWVSTPYLERKYATLNPKLISAAPPTGLIDRPSSLLHICYHATASHRDEITWLADVVDIVQSQASHTHFEVFGDAEVKRYYRGIPRVSILHSMSWPEYLAWTGSVRRDIALAPLLPSSFNIARGPTKFFDYTRLDAAGIYSDVRPYQGFIRDGVDGVLVGNDPEQWAGAILDLVADEDRRKSIAVSARYRALQKTVPRVAYPEVTPFPVAL